MPAKGASHDPHDPTPPQPGDEPVGRTPPEPAIKSQTRFAWIWLVPLAAIGIGLWLIYERVAQQGVPITVLFQDASGLEAGRSVIRYGGVDVGRVERFELTKNMDAVRVHATLDAHAEPLARKGSTFWIVRPEVRIDHISGLETLTQGSYLAVAPGDGEPQRTFTGLRSAPPRRPHDDSLALVLVTDQLPSLSEGSPVYYRRMPVGEVIGFDLTPTADQVAVAVRIDRRYAPLVRENSVFWSVSGFNVDAGILGLGAKVQLGSLKSLVLGGVSFATPNDPGPPATAGRRFELEPKARDRWRSWSPKIQLPSEPAATAASSGSDATDKGQTPNVGPTSTSGQPATDDAHGESTPQSQPQSQPAPASDAL